MIKKFKRYISNLSYKGAINFIVRICSVIGLISIFSIILKWKTSFSNMDAFDLVAYILIAVFLVPFLLGLFLFVILGVPLKEDKAYKDAIEKLKQILINSDNDVEIIPNITQEYFPKDILLFYLEQKGIQFWITSEDSSDFNFTIYITDNDNPEKKFIYPNTIQNPLYVLSHFKFKN